MATPTTLERPSRSPPQPAAGHLERFLAAGRALPTAPAIAARILEAVRSDDGSMGLLAKVIGSDPVLTARVLAVANSSLYAPARKVERLDAAITLIGTNALKNIALSFVVLKALGERSGNALDVDGFMRRALTGAVAAELAAPLAGHRGDVFAVTLLRDVGTLAFAVCADAEHGRVLDEAALQREELAAIERRVFGFDHAALGAEVLQHWGLPDSLCAPIRWHHQPERAPEGAVRTLAELIELSDRIADVYHGHRGAEQLGHIKRTLCGRHGAAEGDVDAMIDRVAERMREVFATFALDASAVKPYSQLLQEANEELRKLNLSYEQLVMQLKQSQQRAEKLAAELREANAALRELATRDGLTGLYNHRTFQDLLRRETAVAQRHGRPLAVVLFDLDHFKKVNDQHGHPAGDTVLREVSRVATQVLRASDVVARYGGEEFAVILPETDARGAVVLAERIRREIEALEIPIGGEQRVRVTVSLGVCPWAPGQPPEGLQTLVEAADKALYAAKNSGRNRVCCGR